MKVYVLLKGDSTAGRYTFHGVAFSEPSALAWSCGSWRHWYYKVDSEAGDVIATRPLVASNGAGIGDDDTGTGGAE